MNGHMHFGGHGADHEGLHFRRDEHGGFRGRFGRHGGGGHGERMERGALRFILLDALKDGPKHGYEIIKSLEERTSSRYSPSPGIVYPTLQFLNDEGLIESDQQQERRVYKLTDAGIEELKNQTERIDEFWSRFPAGAASASNRHEIGFLRDEIEDLTRTVWSGLRGAIGADNPELIRLMRREIEASKGKIRDIIADHAADSSKSDGQPSGGTQA